MLRSLRILVRRNENPLHDTTETEFDAQYFRSPLARISLAFMPNLNRLSLNQGSPQMITWQLPLANGRGTFENTLTNPRTTTVRW